MTYLRFKLAYWQEWGDCSAIEWNTFCTVCVTLKVEIEARGGGANWAGQGGTWRCNSLKKKNRSFSETLKQDFFNGWSLFLQRLISIAAEVIENDRFTLITFGGKKSETTQSNKKYFWLLETWHLLRRSALSLFLPSWLNYFFLEILSRVPPWWARGPPW